jgi:hypothetical protein
MLEMLRPGTSYVPPIGESLAKLKASTVYVKKARQCLIVNDLILVSMGL